MKQLRRIREIRMSWLSKREWDWWNGLTDNQRCKLIKAGYVSHNSDNTKKNKKVTR